MILYQLWLARNEVRDEVHIATPHAIIRKSTFLLEEWQGIRPARTAGSAQVTKHWLPPEMGWTKLNADGAFSVKDGSRECGVVMRDHDDMFLAGASHFFHLVSDPERADLLACKQALVMARTNGLMKVVLETDCLGVVAKIRSSNYVDSTCSSAVIAVSGRSSEFFSSPSPARRLGSRPRPPGSASGRPGLLRLAASFSTPAARIRRRPRSASSLRAALSPSDAAAPPTPSLLSARPTFLTSICSARLRQAVARFRQAVARRRARPFAPRSRALCWPPFFVAVCGLFTRLCPRFTDSVFVGSPLYTDFRGLFTRLFPRFADFVYVGPPLYIDFCGLFPRLWPRFVDSVYVGPPFYIDFCGLFPRLWPRFVDSVYVGPPLYIDFCGLFALWPRFVDSVYVSSLASESPPSSSLHPLWPGWPHFLHLLDAGSQFTSAVPGSSAGRLFRIFCSCTLDQDILGVFVVRSLLQTFLAGRWFCDRLSGNATTTFYTSGTSPWYLDSELPFI
ncbi:hypothetical protein QYE76_057496 [Lolium multiflorum]|uniref:RNase H type-1 domain-containing protein n=1 Tax=Lolium multiflorum TaxID=4521 RepID=A0AAD8WNU9_LOLMU|nr:hypothetical protein QYE76_057496 [Lolium multiflorum]